MSKRCTTTVREDHVSAAIFALLSLIASSTTLSRPPNDGVYGLWCKATGSNLCKEEASSARKDMELAVGLD